MKERQKILKEAVKLAKHSKVEAGSIRKNTQKYYTAQNGKTTFEAEIALSQTSADVVNLNLGKAFYVTVSIISENLQYPSKISITGWKAQFVKSSETNKK